MYVALNVHVVIVRSVLDFRKDSLNGDILIGHNELVVLYLDIASDDLPLLEVVAVIALGGENYLGACDSIGCGSGSGTVLISQNNDLVLCGEYGLNFNILVGHNELVVLYLDVALYDLPLLEGIAFLGGSGEGYLIAVKSLFLVGGSGAVAVGCDLDAALLDEDNFDNNISVGHDELVARYSDLVYTFFNDLFPTVEDPAAVGLCMKGYLRARNSGLGNGIGLALANGDYRDAVLLGDYLGDCLEDCLNFNVLVGHDKLVVRYLYAALYDLPLLEAEALVGFCGKGDFRACESGFRGCGCSAVFGCNGDCVCNGINFGLIGICGDCENQSEQHEAAEHHT